MNAVHSDTGWNWPGTVSGSMTVLSIRILGLIHQPAMNAMPFPAIPLATSCT